MGIHCQCPNGHTLNLKSFLAGKRGICPECQAKFIIPRASVPDDAGAAQAIDPMVDSVRIQTTSDRKSDTPAVSVAAKSITAGVAVSTAPRTGTVTAQASATKKPASATEQPASTAEKMTPATEKPVAAATTTDRSAASPADPMAWYVRLESGEKFGPADTKTLRAWSAEGRVPPSAQLWHEGWDGWHKAETVLTGASIDAPVDDTPPAAGRLATGQSATGQSSSKASASSWAEHNFPLHNDEPHVQTEGRHEAVTLKHRRRRGESRKVAAITIMLLLLVVMLPVLLLVVFR